MKVRWDNFFSLLCLEASKMSGDKSCPSRMPKSPDFGVDWYFQAKAWKYLIVPFPPPSQPSTSKSRKPVAVFLPGGIVPHYSYGIVGDLHPVPFSYTKEGYHTHEKESSGICIKKRKCRLYQKSMKIYTLDEPIPSWRMSYYRFFDIFFNIIAYMNQ
jgi:hypothetical protein